MVFFWRRKKKKAPDKPMVYHVEWNSSAVKWFINEEGVKRPISTHHTKKEAVESARKLAKSSKFGQLIVYKMDGMIESEFSFGQA